MSGSAKIVAVKFFVFLTLNDHTTRLFFGEKEVFKKYFFFKCYQKISVIFWILFNLIWKLLIFKHLLIRHLFGIYYLQNTIVVYVIQYIAKY